MAPSPNPALFFQLAAALIPALLFGGVLAEHLKPGTTPQPFVLTSSEKVSNAYRALGLSAIGMIILGAEVVALSGALGNLPSPAGTWLVALTVVLATLTLTIAVISPRVRWRLLPRYTLVLVAATLAFAGFSSARLLKESVDVATTRSPAPGSTELDRPRP